MGCKFSEPIHRPREPTLDDFCIISPLWIGDRCDVVRKVEYKRTGAMFALRYMDKGHYVRKRAVESLVRERMLLNEINHPFIVNLRSAFQDKENCYFVLDLMEGGDLWTTTQQHPHIPEHIKKLWIAEIASALSYLHTELQIVHRDVTPTHILLSSTFHAHLSHFHLATPFSSSSSSSPKSKRQHYFPSPSSHKNPHKLTSISGTLPYTAPEILERKGYSFQVDWWSLGVTAYEIIFGELPFGSHGRGRERETEQAILADDLVFPEYEDEKGKDGGRGKGCSEEGIDAIACFLERNPKHRLGCRRTRFRTGIGLFKKTRILGIEDVQRHPWFANSDIPWDALYEKRGLVDFKGQAEVAGYWD